MVEEFVVRSDDGFPLAVQTGGSTGAPPLLLLQGQANSHRWWDRVRVGFEATYRTITMDYRGSGRSRGEVGAWTTSGFAADAARVLDEVVGGPAMVYGTSMGGRAAQWLAAEYPDRVTALVLACSSPGGAHATERGQDLRRSIARTSGAERLRVLHELFYTPQWPHPPEASTLLGDPSMNPQERAAHLRASDRHDAWAVLPSITAPTLVLHGGDDRMTPAANSELLAGRIPGAELRIWPHGRHGFFEEFSSDVNPVVLDFLASHLP